MAGGGLQHPRFARAYARVSVEADRRGAADHRRRLVTGLRGRVVEVGAGNGLMFAHYPGEVTEVLAVEPEDTLRALSEGAARSAPVPVRVVAGDADHLPVADGSADAVVASLVLCSVPDQASALAEIVRVLRPGGELRYYEHVRSPGVPGMLEDAVSPVWPLLAGGCHPNRRTSQAITASGLTVEREDRFRFRPSWAAPAALHVLGTARRTGRP
ncbi:MAG TPA: class I SAM-dependent methyltransferase [Kineosporiaceae bacterium]|nr:class I SAM-dependent methyltransferase [Kineosporiaceae bacterium]